MKKNHVIQDLIDTNKIKLDGHKNIVDHKDYQDPFPKYETNGPK